jgi:hypothetical protein
MEAVVFLSRGISSQNLKHEFHDNKEADALNFVQAEKGASLIC